MGDGSTANTVHNWINLNGLKGSFQIRSSVIDAKDDDVVSTYFKAGKVERQAADEAKE